MSEQTALTLILLLLLIQTAFIIIATIILSAYVKWKMRQNK